MLAAAPLRAAQVRAQRHVLQHGHGGLHVDVLEGAADAAAGDGLRRAARDALAPEGDLAGGGGQHARHQVEDRALAGTVGADQRDDLAGVERRSSHR